MCDGCATNLCPAAARARSHQLICGVSRACSRLLRATAGVCFLSERIRPYCAALASACKTRAGRPSVHVLAIRGAPLRSRVCPHARTHRVASRASTGLGARPLIADGVCSWSTRAPVCVWSGVVRGLSRCFATSLHTGTRRNAWSDVTDGSRHRARRSVGARQIVTELQRHLAPRSPFPG